MEADLYPDDGCCLMDSGGIFEAGCSVFFPFPSLLPLNPSCILCEHQADADAGFSVPEELGQPEGFLLASLGGSSASCWNVETVPCVQLDFVQIRFFPARVGAVWRISGC